MVWAGSVSNLTELRQIPANLRLNGLPILVRDNQEWYQYSSISILSDDTFNILEPLDQVGRWLRTGRTTKRQLVSNYTYYVSPSGSDSNYGLAALEPLQTVQEAITRAVKLDALDTIIIQVAEGVYTGGMNLLPTTNKITIRGVINNAALTRFEVDGTPVVMANDSSNYTIEWMSLSTITAANPVVNARNSSVTFNNIRIPAVTGTSAITSTKSDITINGLTILDSGSEAFIYSTSKANMLVLGAITIGADLTIGSGFIVTTLQSLVDTSQATFTQGAFTITGPAYVINTQSLIVGPLPTTTQAGTTSVSDLYQPTAYVLGA